MEELLKELNEELNWKEKIVLKLFKKLFFKTYNIMRIKLVNNLLKLDWNGSPFLTKNERIVRKNQLV